MTNKKTLSDEKFQEIIRRIVKVAQPDRIILFGSAARGEMGHSSDVDLLVIKRGQFHHSRLTAEIYMNLHGVGQAVDVILATPEQVEQYRNTHCLVIAPALREGKEVYYAREVPSRGSERMAE
jgi:predicted nucleotidyltransferase